MIARMGLVYAAAVPALLSVGLAAAAEQQRSAFAPRRDGLTLMGEMVKTQTFLRIRVYALGFYVSDEALQGSLQPHLGRAPTPALYDDLIRRDFEKEIVLRPLRDISAERIRSALRNKLKDADPARVAQLLSYFGPVDSGAECTLRWAPGGALEVTTGGVANPPIADRAFAEAVFGIWLGDTSSALRSREKLVANLAYVRPAIQPAVAAPGLSAPGAPGP
jgi:hypothetical protein